MPRKEKRSILQSRSESFSFHGSAKQSSDVQRSTISMIEDIIDNAETVIKKWDSDSSDYAKISSIFYENREEARKLISVVNDLQKVMHLLISQKSPSQSLIRAQILMQIAMKRLQKEFFQILASVREHLTLESHSASSSIISERSSTSDRYEDSGSDDERMIEGDSIREVEKVPEISVYDLQLIANCMIAVGYGKECIDTYRSLRKSFIDESIYALGFENFSLSQIQKLDWSTLEHKIEIWIQSSKIAVRTLFSNERDLCEKIFSSEIVQESCFGEISKEAATNLFEFPELVAKCKNSPEKIFKLLDLYDSIMKLLSGIESTFSSDSTSAVQSQVQNSLLKLGDSIRSTLFEFQQAIKNQTSRTPFPGGGIHPLTRYVMNYLIFLSDYNEIFDDIFGKPFKHNQISSSYLRELHLSEEDSPISSRFVSIMEVLLSKLNAISGQYKIESLSYIFMVNNLSYILRKIDNSHLLHLLGEEFIKINQEKVVRYQENYKTAGWSRVISSLPEDPRNDIPLYKAKECFSRFNSAFETAYRTQVVVNIPDENIRNEIKIWIARKILPIYREFYIKNRILLRKEKDLTNLLRFTPEDIGNYLSDLFYGTTDPGFTSSRFMSWRPSS